MIKNIFKINLNFTVQVILSKAPTPVLREMCKRYSEYVTPTEILVAVGTYNVNGGKHFRSVVYKDVSLSDWLLDSNELARLKCMNNVVTLFLIMNFAHFIYFYSFG